jgi:hypothetical protein
MARFQSYHISRINLSGCHRSFQQALAAAQWRTLRAEALRLTAREPNDAGKWEDDLVTIEISLESAKDGTKIAVKAFCALPGEPGAEYVRLQAADILRRVDTALRPQRLPEAARSAD